MPFVKGKSGNPGGRPREDNEIKKLAQQECVSAIQRLAFWRDQDNPKASVAASMALLDRGYGKATQAIEHSGSIAMTHEEQLLALDGTGPDDAEREDDPA